MRMRVFMCMCGVRCAQVFERAELRSNACGREARVALSLATGWKLSAAVPELKHGVWLHIHLHKHNARPLLVFVTCIAVTHVSVTHTHSHSHTLCSFQDAIEYSQKLKKENSPQAYYIRSVLLPLRQYSLWHVHGYNQWSARSLMHSMCTCIMYATVTVHNVYLFEVGNCELKLLFCIHMCFQR